MRRLRPRPRPRATVARCLALPLAALVLFIAGCTNDPKGPPLPTGIQVAETLRDDGLPVEAIVDSNIDYCAGTQKSCVYLTYFLDDRSHIEPDDFGYSPATRYAYGGTVEVYPDSDKARQRGVELKIDLDRTPSIEYAIYTAGVVVLSLGDGFLTTLGPPYVGDDYRQALEKHYGPVTFAATRPARYQVPYPGATPTAPIIPIAPTPSG